jgi:hypothetical protein
MFAATKSPMFESAWALSDHPRPRIWLSRRMNLLGRRLRTVSHADAASDMAPSLK